MRNTNLIQRSIYSLPHAFFATSITYFSFYWSGGISYAGLAIFLLSILLSTQITSMINIGLNNKFSMLTSLFLIMLVIFVILLIGAAIEYLVILFAVVILISLLSKYMF